MHAGEVNSWAGGGYAHLPVHEDAALEVCDATPEIQPAEGGKPSAPVHLKPNLGKAPSSLSLLGSAVFITSYATAACHPDWSQSG